MIPPRPTREDSNAAGQPREIVGDGVEEARATESGELDPSQIALGTGRKPIGGAEDNGLHPPHVTANDQDAPLQRDQDRPGDIAALGANASGSERKPAAERIDPASAYEGRREENKDDPPSEGVQ